MVATGFFAVPTASGMSVTDFAELVGVAIVLREIVQFALGLIGGRPDRPDSGDDPDAG